jgi:hypothetical protein
MAVQGSVQYTKGQTSKKLVFLFSLLSVFLLRGEAKSSNSFVKTDSMASVNNRVNGTPCMDTVEYDYCRYGCIRRSATGK